MDDHEYLEADYLGLAILPRALARDGGLSASAKAFALALASYAGPERTAWPKLSTLEADTGMSRSTCQRAVRELQAAGYLAVDHQTRPGRGKVPSLYRLTDPSRLVTSDHPTGHPRPMAPVTSDQTDVSPMTGPIGNRTSEQDQVEQSVARVTDEREDVMAVCNAVANHARTMGYPAPKYPWPAAWTRPARLMLDRDGVTLSEALAAVRWLADPSRDAQFWATNVRSPDALRRHLPKMRAQAARRPGVVADWSVDASRFVAGVQAAKDMLGHADRLGGR